MHRKRFGDASSMSKRVVLIYNMGHSGGRWLQDVFNRHPDVQLWQEANHYLKVDHLDSDSQLDSVYEFFRSQLSLCNKRVIGLIKSFDDRSIKLCEEYGGSIFQMYSHPVNVLDAKDGKKIKECVTAGLLKLPANEEDTFRAHAMFYASIYKTYIDRSYKWPIIKLEDLNESIKSDFQYFIKISKIFFDIEWNNKSLVDIRSMYNVNGNLSRAYSEHTPSCNIFNRWPEWKKSIFTTTFSNVLIRSGYRI